MRVVVAAVVLAVASWSSTAGADPADAGSVIDPAAARLEEARALFEEGARLSQAEEWQEAAAKYQASLRLKRHPMTLYSLGVVERELARPLAALGSFRAFLLESGSGREVAPFRQAALEAIDELAGLVGRVVVDASPATATIDIDGEACVAQREPCLVDAGTKTVTVRAPGHESATREVKVARGATVTVNVELRPTETPVLPMVLLGAGGAAFVAGLVTTIVGVNASAGSSEPSGGTVAEIAVGNALMGAGLAGVAVGWTWLALEPGESKVALMPFVSVGGAGLSVTF